ncbi:MAG: hypothetical protein VCA35_09625, partial [Roseibacillus sp.]
MKLFKNRTALWALVLMALSPAVGALTLEELAVRMERLEKKVEAYEKRYGPLDEAEPPVREPAGVAATVGAAPSGSKGGLVLEDAESIDRLYNSGDTTYTGNNWWDRTTFGGYGEMH